MKFTTALTLLLLTTLLSFQTTTKKRILFFGDSITQQGWQAGGYIKKVDSLMAIDKKDAIAETLGAGIGGNKVYDLYLRMEEDVLAKSPDIVVVYIGVNDVWHKASAGTGTDYDKFGKFYEAIVKKLQVKNIKVILATPAVIGERFDGSNQQDGDLNFYSNWIRQFAVKQQIPVVDLRSQFLEYSKNNNPNNSEKGILTTDRVHLNAKGNELVAVAMWNVIKEML